MAQGIRFAILVLSILFSFIQLRGQVNGGYDAIYSGVPWFDDQGKIISAHGANIVRDNGRFYLFGEAHSDTSNAFAGFNCYSSKDLYNWRFESVALAVQSAGKLGPNRVGERPKVMRCPATGEYIMFMHADTLGYKDQFVGYATSANISGPYTFRGPLLFNGNPIRKWDMGTFQDIDGSGYILIHGGEIYKLNQDYKSVSEQLNKSMTSGFESPTMFRKGDVYYFLGSNLTSWERNDNYYYTASSLNGPWTNRGLFAPEGSLTWNSQSTFVLTIPGPKDTTYLFMGDRWSFPKQASSATYVWQPLRVSGVHLTIPSFMEAWNINLSTGENSLVTTNGNVIENKDKRIIYTGNWKHGSLSTSDTPGAAFSINFKGKQIRLYCKSKADNGYARVILSDRKGRVMQSCIVDMYSKSSITDLKFVSSLLPAGNYRLTVSVMGERPNWSDKKRSDYGSTGYSIAFDKLIITE